MKAGELEEIELRASLAAIERKLEDNGKSISSTTDKLRELRKERAEYEKQWAELTNALALHYGRKE